MEQKPNMFAMNRATLKSILFLIFCALLAVTGCTDRERLVTGQVFIVLKNRETLKLSLVRIDVVSEDVARLILARVDQGKTNLATLKPRLAEKDALFVQAFSSQEKITKEISDLELKLAYLDKLQAKTFEDLRKNEADYRDTNERLQARKKLRENDEGKLREHVSDRSNLQSQVDLYRSNAFYFAGQTNPPLVSVTTDADGRFIIKLKDPGHLYVVAHASRAVGEKTEEYGWILPLSNEPQQAIHLSNDNLIAE